MKQFKPVIQWMDPKALTPYARNAKIHSTEQIDKIAGQIAAVGWTQPIVVDKEKVIIAGHGRREAAIRLNHSEVPVVIADHLNEYEAMAARIADNKVSSGEYDKELLKFDIGTLELHSIDLKLTALDDLELDELSTPDDQDSMPPVHVEGEIEFSKEIDEKNDYLVFLFNSKEDFKAACEKFNVKQVLINSSATLHPGFETKGLGRILDGKTLL